MVIETYGSYASYDLLQLFYFNIAIPGTIGAIALDVAVTGKMENFLHMLRQLGFKLTLGNKMPPDVFLQLQCRGRKSLRWSNCSSDKVPGIFRECFPTGTIDERESPNAFFEHQTSAAGWIWQSTVRQPLKKQQKFYV